MRAFQAAERKRTQMLWGLLVTGWSRVPSEAMPDQLRRTLNMETRIGAKQALLREQSVLPDGKRSAPMIEALERDLRQLQDDHAGLLTSVAQGQYRYAAPTVLAAGLAGPVRAALGPSRVLVEYLVGDDRSYAFVLSTAGVKVVQLAVGRESLRQQVGDLLLPFGQLRSGTLDLTRLDFNTRAAHTLYQAVFAPVQPFLGGASDVVIVPDDVLNILPFEALVERAPQGAAAGRVVHAQLADAAFLLRRHAISYLTSSAQLLTGAGAVRLPTAQRRLFAMANPAASRVQPAPNDDDPLKRQLRSASFDAYFTALPGADAEVRRIARYFAPGSSTIFTGGRRYRSCLQDERQRGGRRALRHPCGRLRQPAALLDADSRARCQSRRRRVSAGVRSAAHSASRGARRAERLRDRLGSEDWGQGLVGLAAAFEQAGARSVLATLWSIDESTSDVMAAFYSAMAQGGSTSAALRQAKLQLLQRRMPLGNVEISLAHPFFWAPFKLMGVPPR